MSGREERFIRDVDHRAAKRLADTPGIGVMAFEDLSQIRRLARKGTGTGRRRRNMLNQWPFSQLQEFTSYKAAAKGIQVVMVDPRVHEPTVQQMRLRGQEEPRPREVRLSALRP